MFRIFTTVYALFAYVLFIVSTVLLGAFLLNFEGMRSAPTHSILVSAAINLTMVTAFGVTHSVMARPWFKAIWTQIIPPAIERATYVLQSSVFLFLFVWHWQAIPQEIWQLDGFGGIVMYGIFGLGAVVVVLATFMLGHLEFVGLSQAWAATDGEDPGANKFRTPLLYRIVRHPLQLGLILMFFATPHMTVGHMLFAVTMTIYIFIGLFFEERALVRTFGDTYRDYQKRIPKLLPLPRPRRAAR